eukprot:34728_1
MVQRITITKNQDTVMDVALQKLRSYQHGNLTAEAWLSNFGEDKINKNVENFDRNRLSSLQKQEDLSKEIVELSKQLLAEKEHTRHISETVTRFSAELDCSRTENERLRSQNEKLYRDMENQAETIASLRDDKARLICESEQTSYNTEDAKRSSGVTNPSVFVSQICEQSCRIESLVESLPSSKMLYPEQRNLIIKQVKILRELADPVGMILSTAGAEPSHTNFNENKHEETTSDNVPQISSESDATAGHNESLIQHVDAMQRRIEELTEEKKILVASLQESLSNLSSDNVTLKTKLDTALGETGMLESRVRQLESESETSTAEDMNSPVISNSQLSEEVIAERKKVVSLLEDKQFLAQQLEFSHQEIDRLSNLVHEETGVDSTIEDSNSSPAEDGNSGSEVLSRQPSLQSVVV